MRAALFASGLVAAVSAAASDHWAVIVAGSNGYWNYRHQSDVHHAYQIFRKQGIPEENIIMMAYDDIATNSQNPFPGQIFNHPNGENVYNADAVTYKGRAVTPDNFRHVLTGQSALVEGRPVLQSDENSKVFVYFSDHGAPGLLAFPGAYLYQDQLEASINTMIENKMFKNLVFYIEACESGSMFPNLAADSGVYAVTASNATLSSWASYCYPDDVVNGVEIGSCLGDLFSTNWMEDSDANDINRETLAQQF